MLPALLEMQLSIDQVDKDRYEAWRMYLTFLLDSRRAGSSRCCLVEPRESVTTNMFIYRPNTVKIFMLATELVVTSV